jgi:rod shape determining protein RodA
MTRARFPGLGLLGDWWLLLAVLSLSPLGLVLIHTTSGGALAPAGLSAEAARQAAYMLVGTVAMLVLAQLDYQLLRRFAPLVYLVAIALLVAALVIGASQFGARRWIAIGPLTVQPSEFAKLAIVAAGAALIADHDPAPRRLVLWAAAFAVPAALVLLEPDLGTALVIGAGWIAMVVAWGIRWRLLLGLAVAGLAVVPIAFAVAVPDYQRERFAVFVHPDRDPLGSGFTLRQVEVALGSGGVTGNGLLTGGASALDGVATRASDFAFAQTGEAFGLAGTVLVIALFALLSWRGIRAATIAPDPFGRMLATGLTATIATQALIHMAVNLRLFPATGIVLPFVSQGGSALVAMFAAIGIIESVAARRPATAREQWTGARWH